MKGHGSGRPAVIDAGDRKALEELFEKDGQVLLPLLELVERAEGAVDHVIDVVGRTTIEALLKLSARQVVGGPKHRGRPHEREIYFYGSQQGEVPLSDRKLKVSKPRLRRRGVGRGGEVEIPAYERLKEGGIAGHVLKLMMRGVSTRNYEPVLREMADTVGVSKSQVSREWIEASAERLEALQTRRFEDRDLLVVYMDGMAFGDHHVLSAIGVDTEGHKHVLGVAPGSSENYQVARDLLLDLIERGVEPDRLRLFVIDGSKALRKAILELFGPDNPIQRCRAHKIRNVTDRLPRGEVRDDAARKMRAAYRLPWKEGLEKMRTLARWYDMEGRSDVAASLREGLEETFTINRLELPSTLRRCLASTNIIENGGGGVRTRTRRVTRWRDQRMVLRWCGAAFLECEQGFRRIMGYRDLWVLDSKLEELAAEKQQGETPKTGTRAA